MAALSALATASLAAHPAFFILVLLGRVALGRGLALPALAALALAPGKLALLVALLGLGGLLPAATAILITQIRAAVAAGLATALALPTLALALPALTA